LTGGRYVFAPPHHRPAEFIADLGIDRQVADRVRDGDRVCLTNTDPYSFLYAPIFHPGRTYHVVEFGTEGCTITLTLPSKTPDKTQPAP